jgi:hypothetical protein
VLRPAQRLPRPRQGPLRARLPAPARRAQRLPRAAARDAHALLALGDFQLADARFLHEIDELLQLAQIHRVSSPAGAARRLC